MKALVAINNSMSVEVEGETHTDLFEGLSQVQEVFSQSHACGVCKGTDVRFSVRTNKDEDKFYELACNDLGCRARLAYGCMKKPKGALYPKRTWDGLSPGEKTARAYQEKECKKGWLPNGGWFVFVPTVTNESVKTDTKQGSGETKAPF